MSAFNAKYLSIQTPDVDDQYGSFAARKLRNALYWALYENTAYDTLVHSFSDGYKTAASLYKAIRSIYSPAYRLGEFAKSYIWGGQLHSGAAQDGALPIETENEALREPLAQVWRWSNWRVEKDVVPLLGAILGDVFLKVVDLGDQVYLEIVHPSIVEDFDEDQMTNVKGYIISYPAALPNGGRRVQFREICTREGQMVVFSTYADAAPYAWNGIAAEWSEPYGFVPLVHVRHNSVGHKWGVGELHAARTRIQEVDDVASVLTDRIRRMMRSGWLFSGTIASASGSVQVASRYQGLSDTEKLSYPHPIREEEPVLYANDPAARAQPLVSPVDIAGAVAHIASILEDLEGDYPELAFERLNRSGALSGTALSKARQPAATKIKQLRATYDDALVRAQQMALSIGGMRGLFPGLSLESYAGGALEHSIADRPVFALDELERAEVAQLFWQAAGYATSAGMPLEAFLLENGYSEEDVAKWFSAEESQNAD